MNYKQQYDTYLNIVQKGLDDSINSVFGNRDNSKVATAAVYSLTGGGKRVRAVLCVAVCDMLCGNINAGAQYAAAIEMLHCYSLIHDDLPCMDDDDFRRGRQSCHKKYGEATALLAGDALLTGAFEVISTANAEPQQNMQAAMHLSRAAGTSGMIYGQELDIDSEKKSVGEDVLYEIHKNKTGALIKAAAQLGVATAVDVSEKQIQAICKFALNVGIVFQIVDDVLDATSTKAQLGKTAGKDTKSDKTTFVKLYGISKSRELILKYTKEMCDELQENFGNKANFLIEFAKLLAQRTN